MKDELQARPQGGDLTELRNAGSAYVFAADLGNVAVQTRFFRGMLSARTDLLSRNPDMVFPAIDLTRLRDAVTGLETFWFIHRDDCPMPYRNGLVQIDPSLLAALLELNRDLIAYSADIGNDDSEIWCRRNIGYTLALLTSVKWLKDDETARTPETDDLQLSADILFGFIEDPGLYDAVDDDAIDDVEADGTASKED